MRQRLKSDTGLPLPSSTGRVLKPGKPGTLFIRHRACRPYRDHRQVAPLRVRHPHHAAHALPTERAGEHGVAETEDSAVAGNELVATGRLG